MRESEDHEQHGLGDGTDDATRCDVNGDATLRASLEINVVVTDTAPANGTKTFGVCERLGRDARFERNEHVIIGQLSGNVFGPVVFEEFVGHLRDCVEKRQADIGKCKGAVFAAEIGREAYAE
jgi:hypothetical protein